jgi:hypothetical protein
MIQQELYWTHTNPLLQTLLNVEGPVLELGGGHYSTAITAAFASKRRVVSVDHCPDWAESMQNLYGKFDIKIQAAGRDLEAYLAQTEPYTKENWGVVFVDHGIITQRGPDLLRFKNNAEVIVMHDSHLDNPEDAYCSFEAIQSFKYYIEHKLYWPQTAVMSETNDLSWLQ